VKKILTEWRRFLLKESSAEEKIIRLLRSEDGQNVTQGKELGPQIFPEEFKKAEELTLKYFKNIIKQALNSKETADGLRRAGYEDKQSISKLTELLSGLEEVSSFEEFRAWVLGNPPEKDGYIKTVGEFINAGVSHYDLPLKFLSMAEQSHGKEEDFDLEAIVGDGQCFKSVYQPNKNWRQGQPLGSHKNVPVNCGWRDHYVFWFFALVLSGKPLPGWLGLGAEQ